MSSPELVASVRLEQLLAGAVPETETEARLQGLARELRSASAAGWGSVACAGIITRLQESACPSVSACHEVRVS